MSGVVRWSRWLFNVVAWLFVAGVAFQVYLAGKGVFAFSGEEAFAPHRGFGDLLGLLTIVLIVLAALGRTGSRTIAMSVLLFVLFVVQSILAYSPPAVAALHPVNGFLIGLVSVVLAWRTRGYLRAPRVEPVAASQTPSETKPA